MSEYKGILTGVLLAGGQNKRFPYLKGFIKTNGVTIIERNLKILKELFPEVLISANDPAPYLKFQMPIIKDSLPQSGPITGIYSCLLHSTSPSVFVITCDMPFVEEGLIRLICNYYVEVMDKEMPFDALIPKYDHTVEPLLGIYRKSGLSAMERAINEKKVMMKRFLQEINTIYFDLSNIISAKESWHLCFKNINTLEDFDRYKDRGLEL